MRLIDADALTKEAGRLWSEMPDGEELSKELMKAINHAPTVEQEAVKPIKTPETVRDEYNCGACQQRVGIQLRNLNEWFFKVDYCPNCGRKVKWDGQGD